MSRLSSFLVRFWEVRPILEKLTDEQAGQLFKAIIVYGEKGIIPELDEVTSMAFTILKAIYDKQADRHDRIAEERRAAAEGASGK